MVMVVNGFVENNVCFEAILVSHPNFYQRSLGWDEIYKAIKLFIVYVMEYSA
jgi:hypothetical protein